MTKPILVLAGGNSPEREVSLRSGTSIAAALETCGYKVRLADPARDEWEEMAKDSLAIFPALHGAGGEDGQVQKILESLAIPFVGSGSTASEICFDKWRYKNFLAPSGVLMPSGELVDSARFASCPIAKKPFVLKPIDGGSSVDNLIARNISETELAAARELLVRYDQMLIEELVSGTEITVGILGDTALPIIEIIPPENGEFDYENKYNGASAELCPPRNISLKIQQKAQVLALKVHNLTGCHDLSRSDFIITTSGEIYLLETNTIPGLTDQSLFPKAASASGLAMPALADQLVKLSLARA